MTNSKKAKKDEQSPSDTFDPVSVDLHQAESAVLMLNSPEDDVKICATEAIYKFALKCEENKKFILAQNPCDILLQLLKSEDKVVKRNVMMVLGVITEFQPARLILIKKPGFVALLIKMLQQEEFDTTKEFALMALSHMCMEFQGINCILEKKGLVTITECLKSTDPDIQKNTLDILCATLQDFEARPMLRSSDALTSLMGLLNSEYPVIQELTLQTFARATQDSTIRTALREMEVLDNFVNIIGNSQFNDIHVPALIVIANLLEDVECAKSLINSGQLKMLLHFITDRIVYHDEDLRPPSAVPSVKDKGGKGKKAPEKKGDKKTKGDTTARKEEDKPPSNTIPEAKIQACRAVMQAARKEEIRKIMHDADVERMLVALLSHEDEGVRSAAAQAVAVLAESSVCQNSIAELGGLELLIRMTRSVHRLPKSAGITALAALTNQNSVICREVANRNSGTEALISCLQVTDPEVEAITVGGLTTIINLALDEATRPKMLQAVSSKLLTPLLLSNSSTTQSKAALAIAAIVCDSKAVHQFCKLGGTDHLVKLLRSPVAEVRRSTCWAVYSIGAHTEAAKALSQASGIQLLQEMNMSPSKRNAFSELALQRVFDANLEAKFALTGYLDFRDNIQDQFYDPGQLLSASALLPLEDYLKQPLNDRRPIYLISVIDPSDHKSEQSANIPITPMNSDPEVVEEAVAVQSVEPQVVVDSTLKSWLEYVITVILPLADPREQAEELGKFVSSCYGGSVDKATLATSYYELDMAELKCSLESNVIPIGCIKTGAQFHRALLFKFFADHIGLPVSLVRGNYGRSYNELLLKSTMNDTKPTMNTYVVDLMVSPGQLMDASSSQAKEYTSILSS